MPYLICDKCNIYYEIHKIEEIEDFSVCECGNELKFYETLEEYINEDPNSSDDSEEDSKGIFYSVNKKNLVYLQMNMLKEQKETEDVEREIRDLKYRLRHAILENKEKLKNSKNNDYNNEFEDKNLKKKKEKILMELELLKRSHVEK